jgi:hypothetical protein
MTNLPARPIAGELIQVVSAVIILTAVIVLGLRHQFVVAGSLTLGVVLYFVGRHFRQAL